MQQHDQMCYKKGYFSKVTAKNGSQLFSSAIKLFRNREIITNDSIATEEHGILKNDPKETTELFNNFYVNVVETTTEKRKSDLTQSTIPISNIKSRRVKRKIKFCKIKTAVEQIKSETKNREKKNKSVL